MGRSYIRAQSTSLSQKLLKSRSATRNLICITTFWSSEKKYQQQCQGWAGHQNWLQQSWREGHRPTLSLYPTWPLEGLVDRTRNPLRPHPISSPSWLHMEDSQQIYSPYLGEWSVFTMGQDGGIKSPPSLYAMNLKDQGQGAIIP